MELSALNAAQSVEETAACFIVCDANGQALAYVYFEEEPGRRAAAKLLTRDQARRMAATLDRAGLTEKNLRWHWSRRSLQSSILRQSDPAAW